MADFVTNRNALTVEDKVINLFTFLKAMNMHRETTTTDFRKYKWNILLRDVPKDVENIMVNNFDNNNDVTDDYVDAPFYLKIHQPNFKPCPLPSKELQSWLMEGWNDYNNDKPQVYEQKEISEQEIVYFKDIKQLGDEFKQWKELRNNWREKQILNDCTKKLFDDLFENRMELMNEAEDLELVIGNGLITSKENPDVYHPIILKRAKFEFDAKKNVIYIMNTDANTEFVMDVFKDLQVEHSVLQKLASEVQQEEYQPWDHFETAEFLKKAVHSFSSHGNFYNNIEESESHNQDIFKVIFEPVIIVRKRPDGTAKTINKIIDYIKEGGLLPNHLVDIVNGGNREVVEFKEESFVEKLAAVGGESTEILLPKQANREQLEIAKRIENYNAVVVQGPPGTGKTHTIANLLGHFLSQGKSVLVTSHTTKALRVLKDKVEKELQPLCVPVLDDSKTELQHSVEAIASYNKSTDTLKQDIEADEKRRKIIIEKLKEIRTSLLRIKNEQCENIVLNGESLSPISAAEFIRKNKEKLGDVIPGIVFDLDTLPVLFDELVELYSSNGKLSSTDENELACVLPSKEDIMAETEFENLVVGYNKNVSTLSDIKAKKNWEFVAVDKFGFNLSNSQNDFVVKVSDLKSVIDIKDSIKALPDFQDWEIKVISDGINRDVHKQSWERLVEDVTHTYKIYESYEKESFGKVLKVSDVQQVINYKKEYSELKASDGKISFIGKFFGGTTKKAALELVTVNGQKISCAADCELVLNYINLQEKRNICSVAWDRMMDGLGIKCFLDLDTKCPEEVALRYCNKIDDLLSWYNQQLLPFITKLKRMGFPFENLAGINDLNSDYDNLVNALKFIKEELNLLCDGILEADNKYKTTIILGDYYKKLTNGSLIRSAACVSLADAVNNYNIVKYVKYRKELIELIDKYRVQYRRNELLAKISKYAPEWADKIRTRVGIHGLTEVPENVLDAWKWKQLNNIINKLNCSDYDSLQKEANRLSNQYREATAKLAADRAWYHLVKRNAKSTDLQQALKGWAYDMKKIGKGTGKLAKQYKEAARKKMIICQKAVPAWIMPIRKAIETLEPSVNKFDIVIVDEASQSDLTALAIAFLGKKVIVVGDDRQVSPLAVGVQTDKVKKDADMYLKGIIPNSELYTPTDSLYTIADTTFQSMMLLEHFRCVPEIIGFSNMLSYDYKIKPLREASSSNILPAIVNYRVADGVRAYPRKINEKEADTIVALIKSCIIQKEYANKTFGVISLLGNEQARLIQNKLCAAIGNLEFEKREIICGDSANFQGDERDVIFLSMVDSNEGDGPLRLTADGREDAFRKRYNVAASRAKDQLWVVHSLDQDNDLKVDDIRKKLLDYARNPQDYKHKLEEIKKKADSPFEVGVANALVARGYNIVQQWPVGAYRIDMVACYGNNKRIAIECDGEQYHSTDDDVLRDMQRQTILERIGWTFIRIRGSEYFKDPESTIDRVVKELEEYGVMPEHQSTKQKRNSGQGPAGTFLH